MQKPLGLSFQRLLCYILQKVFLPSPSRAKNSKGNSKLRTPVLLEDNFAYLEPWIPLFGFSLVLVTPWAFLVGQTGKNSPANAGDPGSIPGSRRSLGKGNGNPLQYSCLGNFMDREACQATVHGVAKSQIWLSDYYNTGEKRIELIGTLGYRCVPQCLSPYFPLRRNNSTHTVSWLWGKNKIFSNSNGTIKKRKTTLGLVCLFLSLLKILFLPIFSSFSENTWPRERNR